MKKTESETCEYCGESLDNPLAKARGAHLSCAQPATGTDTIEK